MLEGERLVFIRKDLLGYGVDQGWVDTLSFVVLIAFIALICTIANFITKQVIIRFITHILSKNKFKWDNILLERKVFRKLSHFVPAIIIYSFLHTFVCENKDNGVHELFFGATTGAMKPIVRKIKISQTLAEELYAIP